MPLSSAACRQVMARTVLPTPGKPVMTAPRSAITAAVNWDSSFVRPISGQPFTPECTRARSFRAFPAPDHVVPRVRNQYTVLRVRGRSCGRLEP
jgi:hypothetical protein